MTMARRFLTILTLISLAVGCSSSPDIPDDAEKKEYRSTDKAEGDDSTEKPDDAKKPAQPSAKAGAEPTKATGPVAKIDGEPIPAEEFNREIERVVKTGMPPQMLGQFKSTIVEKLIDRHLIQKTIEKEGIEISDEEIDTRLDEVREEFEAANQGGKASLDALVKQMGISKNELRDSIAQSIAIEKILKQRGFEEPSEEQAREFYEENKAKFERPEQVHARHILIKVSADAGEETWAEAKERATKIAAEAREEGTDFAKLAEEKSEGPSAKSGGDLGFFGRGRMVPEFENAAFGLKAGQVSEPVKTQFGWHVIKSVEKREAGVVPFEEVSEKLMAQLKNQDLQDALGDFLAELRGQHDIEVLEENIE